MTLLEKLHAIALEVDHIAKDGRNAHHSYDYVKAEDVNRTLREKLLASKILVVPGAGNPQHFAETGGKGFVTTVELSYTFVDIEKPEDTITVEWVGAGADVGGDKGVYKAFTGGFKYALLNLFMISTGEDPERDNTTESTESTSVQKDAARPAAPQIPLDRAKAILESACEAGLASTETVEGALSVTLQAVFKAKLADVGVNTGKIADLNVDQAEDVEAFLAAEKARVAAWSLEVDTRFSTLTLERLKVAVQHRLSNAMIQDLRVEVWQDHMVDCLAVQLKGEVLAERVLDTDVTIPWSDEVTVSEEVELPRGFLRRLFRRPAKTLAVDFTARVWGDVHVPATYWRKFPEATIAYPERLGRAINFPILGIPRLDQAVGA